MHWNDTETRCNFRKTPFSFGNRQAVYLMSNLYSCQSHCPSQSYFFIKVPLFLDSAEIQLKEEFLFSAPTVSGFTPKEIKSFSSLKVCELHVNTFLVLHFSTLLTQNQAGYHVDFGSWSRNSSGKNPSNILPSVLLSFGSRQDKPPRGALAKMREKSWVGWPVSVPFD